MIDLKDQYTEEKFALLIERETDSVELKTGTSRDSLQAAMVAFSNGNGGVIFIGVRDDRSVIGRALDQGTDDKIHEAALAANDLGRYRVQQITVGNKPVIAVRVWRREEGFSQTSDGRILVRRGGRNVALFGSTMWEFMSERVLRRFERADAGLPLEGVSAPLLEAVSQVFGWSPRAPGLRDRLKERGLLTEQHTLTIAGALFLTEPRDSLNLNKAVVEVRRYEDDGPDYDRREEFGGPLQEQVKDATTFVVDEIGRDLVVAGLYRYDLPRLPEVVVREAIANAVAHRTYEQNRTSVLVELRPDAVIVTSPGSLPEPVTVRTIRQAQAARNPDVIDVLRRFSLAEDAGRGVDVMQDEMEEALLDPPLFSDDGASVRVVLPLKGPITPRERAWVADLERRGRLLASDRVLLVHAARGERLTNASAREILATDNSGAARLALHRLRDAGLLVQYGERGGATYTIAESIAPPAAYRLSPGELEDLVVERARAGPVSNQWVRSMSGLDREQALAVLQRLTQQGRLTKRGERRGTRYYATGV